MSISFLTSSQLESQLALGHSVEQWLGHVDNDEYRVIKWLRIDREKSGEYSLTVFEVFDDGSPDFLDIYEFEPVDPDLPYGDINTFDSLEATLEYAINEFSVDKQRFVGNGIIQDIYAELLEKNGVFGS